MVETVDKAERNKSPITREGAIALPNLLMQTCAK